MPALFTQMSIRPSSASAVSTRRARSSRSTTSQRRGTIPGCVRASSSSRSTRRPQATTRAPASASTVAKRAPRPLEAPVTIATRSLSGAVGIATTMMIYSTDFSSTNAREVTPMPGAVETEPIQYEVDGHIARIWLNRPHKLNSVSQQLLQELDEARIRAEEDDNIRVIVFRGRDGTFCSGFDLDELMGDFIGNSSAYEIAVRSARILDAIFRCPKPSVAVLEGHTTAGGFEIMINCDFAIAEENAKIGDYHGRRGLFGGAGPIYRLPRIVGERKAKELML